MNVTNIGFPVAAPASQGGTADAGMIAGFADLIGAGGAGIPQAGLVAGMPPGVPAGTPILAGDQAQVAMAQLLATAAPAAVAPPVVAGGNPLADAIAKALAKPVPAGSTPGTIAPATAEVAANPASAPVVDKGVTPQLPVTLATDTAPIVANGKAPPEATVPTKGSKTATSAPADAALPAAAAPAQPDTPVALDAPAAPELDTPTLPRTARPTKTAARPAAAEDALLPAPADMGQAVAQSQPQLLAVPQAIAQPAAPSTPKPAAQAKADGAAPTRVARVEASFGADTAPATTTSEKTADLARAVSGQGTAGNAEAGSKGETGQQSFAQQFAAADTRQASLPPLTTAATAAPAASTPIAAAHGAAAPATSEPVINARAGELGRTLGVEIARKVDAGEDTLRVRLNPAELGRVEVTLAFDDKGTVQATMRAESQHTLDLLRQDAPDLGRALEQAGIRSDAGSFRFESRDGGTGSNAGGQSAFQQQQQSRGGNQQFQDEPDLQSAAYRPVRSDGQVDLIA